VNRKEWFSENIKDKNGSIDLYSLYDDYCQEVGDIPLDTYKRYCRKFWNLIKESELPDRTKDDVRFKAEHQKLLDSNRVARKISRESFRVYNTLEEYNRALIDALVSSDLSTVNTEHKKFDKIKHSSLSPDTGIIVLSDIHANNNVYTDFNTYDFKVLSKRLKFLITRAIKQFKSMEITSVLVVNNGDMISSDRRLSEQMTQATSTMRATLLVTHIVKQALLELSDMFNVSYMTVCGNESRFYDSNEGMSSVDLLVSNNGDYLVHNILKEAISSHVKFIETNYREVVLEVDDITYLFLHGDILKKDKEKSIRDLVAKYATLHGVLIDYVIFSHYHNSKISDTWSGTGTMMGGDEYSTGDLMYTTRASQNIYYKYGHSVEGLRIDLQDVEDFIKDEEAYYIDKELERYRVKTKKSNVQVVINSLV